MQLTGNVLLPQVMQYNDSVSKALQPTVVNSSQASLPYVEGTMKLKITNGEYVNMTTMFVRDPSRLQIRSTLLTN